MKICTQCGVEKSLDKFPRRDGKHRSPRNRCAECIKRSGLIVKKLRKEYLEKHESIPETCACCGTKSTRMVCDHDHQTEKFRGFICSHCNAGIGLLGDNLEGILNAQRYLKECEFK
jgi:uncharacterized ferredoxin-like protein